MGSMEINITNIHSVLILEIQLMLVNESLFQEELLKFASRPQKKSWKEKVIQSNLFFLAMIMVQWKMGPLKDEFSLHFP